MSLGLRRRVSYSQLEALWEILNQNRSLATGYNKTSQAREFSKRMWRNIAETLNAYGDGASKDSKAWCKYWNVYKSKLKSRVAAARSSLQRTGGGPSNEQQLTEIELQFLQILGEDFGSGIPEARVEPFDVPPPVSQELEVQYSESLLAGVELIYENDSIGHIQVASSPPLLSAALSPLAITPRRSPRLIAQQRQLSKASSSQVTYVPTSAQEIPSRPVLLQAEPRRQRQRRGEPPVTQQAARRALMIDAEERTNISRQKLVAFNNFVDEVKSIKNEFLVFKDLVHEVREMKNILLTRLPLPSTSAE